MKVAILDAGAQYGKVIDRRVRELSIETEMLPLDTPSNALGEYGAIILTGGPDSVTREGAPQCDPRIFSIGKPVLGICYGLHLMAHHNGGSVVAKERREDGECDITVEQSPLFAGLDSRQRVLMSHGYTVDKLADGFQSIADSSGLIAAIEHPERRLYGLQFHPEVDLTARGREIFRNFLYNIARLEATFTMENREERAISYLRDTVGSAPVLALVSGGVDSTVLAALLNRALDAKQLHAIHIDNGFMRTDESAQVARALADVGVTLDVIDARADFYGGTTELHGRRVGPLRETTNPEEKRHIIGDTFMRVASRAMAERGLDPETTYLAQGTLRPDLIESASKLASASADTIKTHHNDTELVRQLRETGRVVEPLQELHKDEVRELGRMLGLPEKIVGRQPFPGPGLAVRLLCTREPYRTEGFAQLEEELQAHTPVGTRASLLPIRTVGVQGDGRSYSYLVGLSGAKDWDALFSAAREIPKSFHDVNRVVYLFGDRIAEPVMEITPTLPTEESVSQLRAADAIVNDVLTSHSLDKRLSQVPVVSFPVGFGIPGARSIGIRTFITNDFMTGRPAVPGEEFPHEALDEIVSRVGALQGIARVAYDLTAKPPGTTEWE